MVDLSALRQIFSAENAAWTAVLLFGLLILRMWNGAPAMFEQWVAYKKALAAEKAADWARLREENKRLDDRCIRLEESEERCRDELNEVKARISQLEGWMTGQGSARQEAAGIVAIERSKDQPKP